MKMFFLWALAAFISLPGFAQEKGADDKALSETQVNQFTVDQKYLENWGIDEQEYRRFQYIKQNTYRQYFTPNVNPIVYLGLEARTEAERMKYARKMAQMEWENFEKIMAFTKAQQKASVELYGAGNPVDYSDGNAFMAEINQLAALSSQPQGISISGRKLFIRTSCDSCDVEYQKLFNQIKAGQIDQLEVVFSGADNKQMLSWARRMQVPAELNKRGVIVLRGIEDGETIDRFPTVKHFIL